MKHHDSNVTRWISARRRWLIVGGAGILAMGLGVWGFLTYSPFTESHGGILDAVYRTGLLFMFQFTGDDLGHMPWPLEVARFLAPAVTSYTVVLPLLRMMGQRWQLTRLTGHVVVCGLGYKGVYLAKKHLRDGKKVVIIEADEDNDWIEVCRSLGAVVLNGDAADEDMLRQAHVASACQLIAVCEKDTANIQIAVLAGAITRRERPPALEPLRCLVHIVSLKWCTSLNSLGVLDGTGSGCISVSFNFFENSARALLTKHPLDREQIRPDDPRQVHLVLIGANDMAEAIMIQTIRSAHFANNLRPRITVIGGQADQEKNLFYAQFPFADKAADIEFRNGQAQDPDVRQDLAEWASDSNRLMTVAVCIQEETSAVETALTLPTELRQHKIPVFVRLAVESGIAGMLECIQQKLEVRAFGSIQDGCDIRDGLDQQAKAFHADYLAEAKRAGRTAENDPAMRPWEKLDSGFKDSNRQQADHIPVKLRAVGCVAVKEEESPDGKTFAFTNEEVELLARMEHARWCAERFLAGWTLGPSDKPRQISPCLVPYDQLEDKIKEYDRVGVRNIPKILRKHVGMEVKRL
ncbi:MAG: NAD-binding protein [Pontiellaceae bacterium]|jgi:voltage-gated potassium channel Kch|nr:NAD-binding protein [Pontiellaceae bacterium]